MNGERHIDGRDAMIEKAVFDKAGATVNFRKAIAVAVAFALPVALGGLLSGLPGLVVIARNWHNATYALLEFHRTAHLAYFLPDHADGVTLQIRLDWLVKGLLDLSAGLMGLCILALAALLMGRSRAAAAPAGVFDRRLLWLCGITLAVIGASLLLAQPLRWQYAAPALPLAAAVMTVLSRMALRGSGARAAPRHHSLVWGGLLPAVGIALVLAGGLDLIKHNQGGRSRSALDHFAHVVRGPYPDRAEVTYGIRPRGQRLWLSQTMGGFVAQMDGILRPEARPGLKVATDMPAFPLEAGLGVYPELASMPFFYEANDDLPRDRLARLNGVSPATIRGWMAETDVRAVLVGEANTWNRAGEMEAYAKARAMACFRLDMRGAFLINRARLYVDPALAARAGDCPADPPPAAADGARVASGGDASPSRGETAAAGGLAPGAYRVAAGAVEVHLRDFVYPRPRGPVPGRALRVSFRDGRATLTGPTEREFEGASGTGTGSWTPSWSPAGWRRCWTTGWSAGSR